jgi:hypothetical protein
MMAGAVCAAALVAVTSSAVAGIEATESSTAHGVRCSVPGEWPQTSDVAWLWQRLRASRYREIGCTGSAFTIDYGGSGSSGHDLYIWASTAPKLSTESPRYRVVANVRIYGNAIRVVWRAGKRSVWLEQGPTSRQLPHRNVLERLVRAATTH